MRHRNGSGSTRRDFLTTMAAVAAAGVMGRPALARIRRCGARYLSGSAATRNGDSLIMIHRPTPRVLSSRAQIVKDDEPGERLTVSGQVFAPDGKTPAPGVIIYAYNTDAQGYYGENRAEYCTTYGWIKPAQTGASSCIDSSGTLSRYARPGAHPLRGVGRRLSDSGPPRAELRRRLLSHARVAVGG